MRGRPVRRLRLQDVRYVIITGAVADRVLAARQHYPFESRFYDRVRKLRRVFWSDPALGVARYVDAGYPEARDEAARHGLDLPG